MAVVARSILSTAVIQQTTRVLWEGSRRKLCLPGESLFVVHSVVSEQMMPVLSSSNSSSSVHHLVEPSLNVGTGMAESTHASPT